MFTIENKRIKNLLKKISIFAFVFCFLIVPIVTNGQAAPLRNVNDGNLTQQVATGISPEICTGLNNFPPCAAYLIKMAVSYLVNSILGILSFFLWLAGFILDTVIQYSVVEMSEKVGKLTIINTVWKIFRDLTNIFFIFALLYVGMMTIINSSRVEWKKYMANVIMAALFINFSLFITKVPIDASNIISLQFYKAMVGSVSSVKSVGNDTLVGNAINNLHNFNGPSLSGAFMRYLNIQTVYNPTPQNGVVENIAGDFTDVILIITKGFFASAIILITALVFLSAAFMLLYRFFILIYVMMISPLYFLGMILPKVKEMIGKDWSSKLIDQCLFAPIFFLLLYISLRFTAEVHTSLIAGSTFAGIGSPSAASNVANMTIGYIFIMGMIIGSIETARKMGAKGGVFLDERIGKMRFAPARWAAKPTAALVGKGYRATIAPGLNEVAKSSYIRRMAASNNFIVNNTGRAIQNKMKAGATASGDFRNIPGLKGTLGEGVKKGYEEINKDNKKYKQEYQTKLDSDQFDKNKTEVIRLKKETSEALYKKQKELSELNKDPRANVVAIESTKKEIANIKETYERAVAEFTKSLRTLGDKHLETLKPAELESVSDLLSASQYAKVVDEKNDKLTESEKAKITESRLGGGAKFDMPVDEDSFKTLKSAYGMNQLSSFLTNNQAQIMTLKASLETATETDKAGIRDKIEAAERLQVAIEREYGARIKNMDDKEVEIVTAHVFNTKKDPDIENFIENMNEAKAEKIAKSNMLINTQKEKFKEIRKNILGKVLTAYKEAPVGDAKNKALEEFTKKFKNVSADYVANMSSDSLKTIFGDKNLIKLVTNNQLQKIHKADQNWTDEASGLDGHDYMANAILRYVDKDGNRHRSAKRYKADNVGMLSIDVDSINEEVTKAIKNKKANDPTKNTQNRIDPSNNPQPYDIT